jgi:hypothetical protein
LFKSLISLNEIIYEVTMSLTASEVAKLNKIVAIAQTLLEKTEPKKKTESKKTPRYLVGNGWVGARRSGKELVAFRKMLKAERKAGASVAEMAKRHGISPSYIYQLG